MPEKLNDAITDVPGIKVGHWTDRRAATGCTVVLCEAGATPGVDVRGGAPGTMGTDIPTSDINPALNAVVLTGGSIFGLASITGVLERLEERGLGFDFGGRTIPIAVGAVIFDLNLGSGDVRPDSDAGYEAAHKARSGLSPKGSVGAGTGATVAKLLGPERGLKGGVGTASEDLGGGMIIGALAVVNAVGQVVDNGRVIAGPRGDTRGEFTDPFPALRRASGRPRAGENTTIGVVATNAKLTKEQVNRLATVAHDGLARAIQPAHTMFDGDTIFALATGEHAVAGKRMLQLETFSARVFERAVIKAINAATSLHGVPSATQWTKPRRSARRPSLGVHAGERAWCQRARRR